MAEANLILHCGAREVTVEQLQAVPCPPAEGRWRPVPHGTVLPYATEALTDLALGGGIADGGVTQEAVDTGADEGDFLGAVAGAVIDEQLFGDAAFVEGGAEGPDQGIDIFLKEELAVAEDAAGVVAAQTLKVRPQPGRALRLLHKRRRARRVLWRRLLSSKP